jgi:hypothetical protein
VRYQAAPQPDAIRFLEDNLTIIAASRPELVHRLPLDREQPKGKTGANAPHGGKTVARTRADQLVEQLIDAGVRHIYGKVGDSPNPIVDAVQRRVLTR